MTVGKFERWNLPKAFIGSYGLDEFTAKASSNIAPYIDYDLASKVVTFNGSNEISGLIDQKHELKITLRDTQGNIANYS